MKNTDRLRGMSNIDKERMLSEDKRTSSEYLCDWISDLDGEGEDELLAVYHLLEAITALNINVHQEQQSVIDPVHTMGACHCRECKYWKRIQHENGECSVTSRGVVTNKKATGFCDCGERRE